MYETYDDKLQPCFWEEIIHLLHIDTGSFPLSVNIIVLKKTYKNTMVYLTLST